MNLYIRLRDGQPFEHPLYEDNVQQIFPDMDLANLPNDWARFTRYQQPGSDVLPVGKFEVPEVKYTLSTDGVTWQDTWYIRTMSDDEKNKVTLDALASIARIMEYLTAQANEQIAATTGETQAAWQTFLTALGTVDTSDPFAVMWPLAPQVENKDNLV